MAEHKKKTSLQKRLARNFHRTFIPERQYLGALLKYAAEEGLYDLQAIADSTNIPTGTSSGKALPTADYCRAMHLVVLNKNDGKERLELTTLGRTILLEDKFFMEPLTQWISHLFLCNQKDGAETWYQLFWNGFEILGECFEEEFLFKWICPILNVSDLKSLSPIFRMYSDDSSFAKCGAIQQHGSRYVRKKAPVEEAFAIGYAAWLVEAIEANGRHGAQVTVDELENFCGFRSITGWTLAESQQVLGLLEQKGLFSIDRHMRPWIVCNKQTAEELWKRLYEDFI